MLGLLMVLCSGWAHDYYLEVSDAAVAPSAPALVFGMVGHGTEREKRTTRPASLLRLDAIVDGKPVTLPPAPRQGRRPAEGWAVVPTTQSGVVPVVYTNRGAEVTMQPDAFRKYLVHEGDDRMVSVFDGLPAGEQAEHYARSLKVLLRVGDSTEGWDAVAGLPLELVPTSDPFAGGETLGFRLLVDGKPTEGVRIRAFPAKGDADKDAIVARTGADGVASFSLPARDGGWVVAAVVMRHDPSLPQPWQSTWTTLRLP